LQRKKQIKTNQKTINDLMFSLHWLRQHYWV